MRIKSSLTAFIAGLALSLSACATEAVIVDEPTAAAEARDSTEQGVGSAPCKLAWTCDYQRYYTTQSQCAAACGAQPCEQDYACNRSCVCP